MKRSKKRVVFLTLGLLCILAALGLTIYNIYDARRADEAAQFTVEQLEVQIEDLMESQRNDSAESSADISLDVIGIDTDDLLPDDREMPTIEIDGYRYIGYLYVPSIDLKLPVMEEWDYDRLRIAPCRYSGSLYQNNLVIAGHNYSHHFSPLRYLDPGTEIQFIDAEGIVYYYHISDLLTLNPTQIEDMTEDSDDWDLTLFTCTLSGQTRHTIRCVRDK